MSTFSDNFLKTGDMYQSTASHGTESLGDSVQPTGNNECNLDCE